MTRTIMQSRLAFELTRFLLLTPFDCCITETRSLDDQP